MKRKFFTQYFATIIASLLLIGCTLPAERPVNASDEFETAVAAFLTATPEPVFTQNSTTTTLPSATLPPVNPEPEGKIIYTCQQSGQMYQNDICVVNVDGSNRRNLTYDFAGDHFFASFAPENQTVVFSSTMNGRYDIYEMDIGEVPTPIQITFSGDNYAPAISPDGTQLVYTHTTGEHLENSQIWIADRDGKNATKLIDISGGSWDPVWSPDGTEILFASSYSGSAQLHILNIVSGNIRQVTNFIELRGRNDWSVQGLLSTYQGSQWTREIITFDEKGENYIQITDGGHNLAPSFSPDGEWMTYTSYRDNLRNVNGCEIYIMRVDGSDIRRLTENFFCDWQPRWSE